jgi:hypothetical protein
MKSIADFFPVGLRQFLWWIATKTTTAISSLFK